MADWEGLDDRALLAPAEVARLFGVHPKTVTRWAEAGALTPIRTGGGHRLYPVWQIRQILQDRGPADDEIDDELLEPREVSRLLGVSTHTLARWADSGELDPVITPTGTRRYRLSQVLQRLGGNREPSQTSDAPDRSHPAPSADEAKDGVPRDSSQRRKTLSPGRRATRRRLQRAAAQRVASPDFPRVLNTEQAAALLGVSAATIRYWAEKRTIPARKDKSGPVWGWVFDRDELLRWLAQLPARRPSHEG